MQNLQTQRKITLHTGRTHVIKMRKYMRSAICAGYFERLEDGLYYRKHNVITQFY
jgi:hypothetical protein